MEEMNIFGERMFKKSLILSKVVFCFSVCLFVQPYKSLVVDKLPRHSHNTVFKII